MVGSFDVKGLGTVLVQSYAGGSGAIASNSGTSIVQPQKKDPNINSDFVSWGEDNLHPQIALEKIRASSILSPVLSWKMKALASMDVRYGHKEEQADGTIKWKFRVIPEVEALLKASGIKRYVRDTALQGYSLNETFIQLIRSKDKNKIVQISCGRSKDYRKGKMNTSGDIEKVYISADWDLDPRKGGDNVQTRDFLDVNDSDNDFRIREMEAFDSILGMAFNETGGDYYQEEVWWSAVRSLVYDNSQNIQILKNARMKNEAAPKWILEIPWDFWEKKYGKAKWDKMTEKEQDEKITEAIDSWAKAFGGPEKQGKMLWTTFYYDKVRGTEFAAWKLKEIPYPKGDENLKDSALFSSHLLMALEVDGSLLGMVPGYEGLGNGGGSQKREAMNLWLLTQKAYFDTIMEPFALALKYNGINDIEFTAEPFYVQQLNQISPQDRNPQNN
jgi:hypothetical protein